jgi:hypothetical protein
MVESAKERIAKAMSPSAFLNRLRDPGSWTASCFFLGAPTILAVLFYTGPPWFSSLCVVPGIAVLVGFAVYLFLVKKGERGSLGSSVPAILGPLVAQFYVEQRATHLLPVWNEGGGLLIQIAFLFASWIGLFVYQFSKTGEDGESKVNLKVGWAIVVGVIFLIAFVDLAPDGGAVGPRLWGDYDAPPPTGLTLCRAAVVLWSIYLATTPAGRRTIATGLKPAGDE